MRRLVPLAVLACLTASCGNERQRAPATPRAADPAGTETVELRRHGVAFERPRNWNLDEGPAPHIATVTSGPAAVNVWRYPRVERLPRSDAELVRARRALIAAARARDPSLQVLAARTVRAGGASGVELVATQRIGVARRQVRSAHLYAHGAEVVVDAYAPPEDYERLDRSVFGPLLYSLRLERPRRRDRP